MANILNKDPLTFQQEKNEFLKEIHIFNKNRGTPFEKLPKIGGKEIDLYLLYRRVISFGGLRKIHDEETWNQISADHKMPKACCNGSQALKHIYVRYLDKYERVHFHGEDPNKKEFDDDNDHAPARKKVKLPLFGIPLTYNHEQHKVTDASREMYGLSQDLAASSDYEKLEKSLLSGLPNEVDFVINVCTLLSNEGRHILRLDQSRYLLTLLLAHIGLFDYSKDGLEDLYVNGWYKHSKRNFVRFWLDTVKDSSAKMLISSTRECQIDSLTGEEVLNLGRDLGKNDKEGQRVMQVAVILRNLSFEEDNCKFMASSDLVFRFLFLCIHCQYGSLRQLALDTFGNLAEKLIIDDDADKNLILDLISKCIASNDKFDVVRGLEILGKMCQIEENELHISEGLDESIYSQLFRLACVFDIQLIVHSLETLYQLSELGEQTSTRIASVKNAVKAQSYGPNSLIGIKVVEYCPPSVSRKEKLYHLKILLFQYLLCSPVQKVQPAVLQSPQQQPVPPPPPTLQPGVTCDVESTTCNWLQATFEIKGDCATSQLHLYAEYVHFCKKYSLPQILPSHSFHNSVKSVFPRVQVVASDRSDGTKELSYHGLSKRQVSQPFTIHCSVSKPSSVLQGFPSANSDLTQTPMLRQRLLDPPRLSPLQASPSLLPVGGAIASSHSAIQLTAASPVMSKSKALLHAKLQQPKIQQSPLAQQSWPQSPQQTWPPSPQQHIVTSSGAIPHVSQGVSVVIAQPMVAGIPQQTLPLVIEGMSADHLDSANKPIETKMIKNLLAKKLRPQSTPVPICPKISEPSSNPMHLLTFTAQQSNVIQGHIQNQPIIPQVIIHQPVAPPPRPVTPKAEKTPKKPVASSQKPQTPVSQNPQTPVSESKRKPTRSSSRVPSPKGTSPKRSSSPRTNSPKSPKTYDLDVCGKIERAKDLTQIGIEARIEHVENKSVPKSDPLPDPSSSTVVPENKSENNDIFTNGENQNNSSTILSDSAIITDSSSSSVVSSTSNLITNDTHRSHNNVCETKETSCDILKDQSESLSLEQSNPSEIISSHSSSTNSECVKKVCDTNDSTKSVKTGVDDLKSVENSCVQTNGRINGIKNELNSDTQQNLDKKEVSVKLNHEDSSNFGTMNGNLSSPEVIIPSPTGETNGNNEMEDPFESRKSQELKQAISKIVDKVGKMNGAINHNIDDYLEHNGENTLVNGNDDVDCKDNTVRVVDANGDEVILRTDGVDLVVNEGDQLIIGSQGTIEVNGLPDEDEDDPMLIDDPPAEADTSDLEVINAVNSIPQETEETPFMKNSAVNSIIQPLPDSETIDAVNSILDMEQEPEEEQSEQAFMDNTSHCYELVGEPSEEETDGDEVIIENEMMLQPSKPVGNDTAASKQCNDAVMYQEDGSATDSATETVDEVTSAVLVTEQPPQAMDTDDKNQTVLILNTEQIVHPPSNIVPEIQKPKEEPQIKPNPPLPESEEVKIRITNEICTTRHVPTPESSRDNELSCDSFASSNTDSDKHSMPSPVASTTQNCHFNLNIIHSNPKPVSSSRPKLPEKKSKKRSRSGSGDSRGSSSTTTVIALEYMCEWSGCKRCFENAKSVFVHVYQIHLSRNPEGYCLWDGCEKLLRKRWSLATHVQDHHCSDSALQTAAIRRFHATQTGAPAQNPRIPALVYPPDAAWQAIRRFTPKPPYPEFMEPREGPVTKHIRLTAALILRNLARYSSLGRSLIKKHESHINYTAMSTVESSTALANCLYEILHDTS
ncbi:ARID2 [Mytilus edulis]|uniref:ARID2 n=1 Tax=Mytilus edulis TaxID=6550 RepID=A0A8S3RSN1_MYTED|nr:ARID2 [Mytilus edulis]